MSDPAPGVCQEGGRRRFRRLICPLSRLCCLTPCKLFGFVLSFHSFVKKGVLESSARKPGQLEASVGVPCERMVFQSRISGERSLFSQVAMSPFRHQMLLSAGEVTMSTKSAGKRVLCCLLVLVFAVPSGVLGQGSGSVNPVHARGTGPNAGTHRSLSRIRCWLRF